MQKIGWRTRAGLVLSIVWLVAIYALSADDSHRSALVAFLGVGPLAVIWGAVWIISGYRAESSAAPEKRESDPRRKGTWTRRTIGIALILASVASVGYFGDEAGYCAARIGYLFGYYIWGLIIVWVIWANGFKRLPGAMLLLSGIMIAGAASWESYKMHREFTDANNFAKYGSVLLTRAQAGEEISPQDISKAQLGSLEPLLATLLHAISSGNAAAREFTETAKRSHFNEILSPSTLGTESGLQTAELSISSMKLALAKYKAARKQIRDRLEVEITQQSAI